MKQLVNYKLFEAKKKIDVKLLNSPDKLGIELFHEVNSPDPDISRIKELINLGVDINIQASDNIMLQHYSKGTTPLMVACGFIRSTNLISDNIVRLLLKQPNIQIDLQDDSGWTALMYACNCTDLDDDPIIDLFIQAGANLNIQNNNGKTAIFYCHNNPENTKKLIRAGIDMTILDNSGDNFIDMASVHLIRFLLTAEGQKMILSREPSLLKSFEHRFKIHPKTKKEFAHLFAGLDLNLL